MQTPLSNDAYQDISMTAEINLKPIFGDAVGKPGKFERSLKSMSGHEISLHIVHVKLTCAVDINTRDMCIYIHSAC